MLLQRSLGDRDYLGRGQGAVGDKPLGQLCVAYGIVKTAFR